MDIRQASYHGIGHHVRPNGWEMAAHHHPFHELIIVIRGAQQVEGGGEQVELAQGDMGLFLRPAGEPPQPGDLVFFNWRTRFQKRRYKGITHVGFFLGQVGDRLLVLEAASRGERRVTIKDRSDSISRIAG